jgi:two-component system, response regulator PdtaR
MPRRSIAKNPVVLVVEDEPLVRELEADIILGGGFRLLEAATADEAFELLRSGAEVHMVFTDVDMPGSINGFEFARLVRQGWPEVAILVASGKMRPGPGDLPAGAEFIAKPYRPAELVQRIRDGLGLRSRERDPASNS